MRRLVRHCVAIAMTFAIVALFGCDNPVAEPPVVLSSNANLSSLNVSSGSLNPAFSTDVTSYTVNVPYETSSITVTGMKADAMATVSTNSGVAQTLNVGPNVIAITVAAEDGKTTKLYSVSVTRAAAQAPLKSSNANLSSLTVSSGTLSPAFSADVTSYAVSVSNAIDSITITGTSEDAKATLSSASGMPYGLLVGVNRISIIVTAEDGTTSKTYAILVTREIKPTVSASDNANLASLTVSAGTLNPAFSADITKYAVTVLPNTDTITVNGIPAQANATVGGINGVSQSLVRGPNEFFLTVTAEDTVTTKKYSIVVTRPSDTFPPKVVGYTLSPTTIDSTNTDQTVTGTVTIEDETELKDGLRLSFFVPFGGVESVDCVKRSGESTSTRAVYDWNITVKKGSRGGSWRYWSASFYDKIGNSGNDDFVDTCDASSFTDITYN